MGRTKRWLYRAEESVGPWQGAGGRQSGQESPAAGQRILLLAPTDACRPGLSKAWHAQGDNLFLYALSSDFVLNGLDDSAVEKNDPGVGRGPRRLEFFN